MSEQAEDTEVVVKPAKTFSALPNEYAGQKLTICSRLCWQQKIVVLKAAILDIRVRLDNIQSPHLVHEHSKSCYKRYTPNY